jgi:hypothetical protein
MDPVIRAHVDFGKKSAQITYFDATKNTEKIVNAFKPVRSALKAKELVEYDSIVDESFHESTDR